MTSPTRMSEPGRVELLTWSGCPSHDTALRRLTEALREIGREGEPVRVRWVETDAEAATARFMGSPTFHVDGRDIFPPASEDTPALTCRIYQTPAGRIAPLPDQADLTDRLRALLDSSPQITAEG